MNLAEFPETFFSWWNGVIEKTAETTEEEFSRFFSDDARIITNEKLVCTGLSEITQHFMGVKEKTDYCRARIPMERIFHSEEKIFMHYLIDASFKSEKQVIAVMGYMLIEQNKIRLSQQLQHVLV